MPDEHDSISHPSTLHRTARNDASHDPHASQHTSSHAATPYSSAPGPTEWPASLVPSPLRVVVADDNPVVRAGLGVLLSGRADIEVVAEAVDGRQAHEMAVLHRPDVVLLDVRMPGVDGLSALPHLVRVAPVMMLTYSRESEIVHEALRLGAGGYLVHGEFTADELVQAVHDTKSGGAHFTATAANALLAHMRQAPAPTTERASAHAPYSPPEPLTPARQGRPVQSLSHLQSVVGQSSTSTDGPARGPNSRGFGLSSREVEVMDLIASGMSNQQIAATCFISEKTVKNHINRIFTKLHSCSRSEAIARWLGTAPGSGPPRMGAGNHG